jgi:hypothetical protein
LEWQVLEFELTQDDLIAYNPYGLSTSPEFRRWAGRYRLIGSLAVLTILTLIIAFDGDLLAGAVAGFVAAGIFWIAWPRLWSWMTKRNVVRLAAGGSLGKPGRCKIWYDDHGVHDQTPGGTSSVSFDAIDRVEESATHAFIFTGPMQGYVIPMRVGEYAVAEFLAVVRARMEP